jgi:endogenous inhibitor of DNA gyrase (YacG/DUF329 family)
MIMLFIGGPLYSFGAGRNHADVNSPVKENSMNCPHCHKHISPKLIRGAAAKLNRSKKTVVPKPKILTPCPHCGELRGVRELRAHRPVCPKNPRVLRHACIKFSI